MPVVRVKGVCPGTERRVEIAAGRGADSVVKSTLCVIGQFAHVVNAPAGECDAGDVDRETIGVFAEFGPVDVIASSAFEPRTRFYRNH